MSNQKQALCPKRLLLNMRTRVRLTTAVVMLLTAALSVTSSAFGAVGDFTVTYDWYGKQNLGFDGWGPAVEEDPSGSPLQTPYYAALLDSSAGVADQRGIGLLPSVASDGTGTRTYPNFNGGAIEGGPKIKLPWVAPGSSTIDSVKFDHVDFSNASDGQILSFTSYKGDGSVVDVVPFIKPKYPPGPPALNVSETLSGGSTGRSMQLALRTICDQNSVIGACPDVDQPVTSYGKMKRITIDLKDPENPVVGDLTGSLVAPGWRKARVKYKLSFSASDASSGIHKLTYVTPLKKTGSQAGFCNRNHMSKQGFLPGAECPQGGSLTPTEIPAPSSTGTYTLVVGAEDDSGRVKTKPQTVKVDNTAPKVEITKATADRLSGFFNGSTSVSVAVTAHDGQSGVKQVKLIKDGKVFAAADTCNGVAQCDEDVKTTFTIPTTDLRSGITYFNIKAIDNVGKSSDPVKIKLKLDRQGPNAVKFPPKKGAVSDGRTVAIKFTRPSDRPSGSQGSGVKSYLVRVVGPNTLDPVIKPIETTSTQMKIVLPKGTNLPNKARIAVSAVDKVGNVGIMRTTRIERTNKPLKTKGLKKKAKKAPKHTRSVIYGISEPAPENIVPSINQTYNPAVPGVLQPGGQVEGAIPYPYPPFLEDNDKQPIRDFKLERFGRANALEAFNNLRVKDELKLNDIGALRAIVPYDIWVDPVQDPNELDSAFNQRLRKTQAARVGLRYLAELARDRTKAGRPTKLYVTLMSDDFTKCDGKQEFKETKDGKPKKIKLEKLKSMKNDRTPCTYPTEPAYSQYFKQWLSANQTYLGCQVADWGAWNEPDISGFTLAYVRKKEEVSTKAELDNFVGARTAARYWRVAQGLVNNQDANPCKIPQHVVAGEFGQYNQFDYSRRFVESYLTEIFRSGGPIPTIWSIHNYRDLLPTEVKTLEKGDKGESREKDLPRERRTYTALNYANLIDKALKTRGKRAEQAAKNYQIWITETGAMLQPKNPSLKFKPTGELSAGEYFYTALWNHPDLQWLAGRDFTKLRDISPRVTKVFYYSTRANGQYNPYTTAPGFDSAYTDKYGITRTVYCGMMGKAADNCSGTPIPDNFDPAQTPK